MRRKQRETNENGGELIVKLACRCYTYRKIGEIIGRSFTTIRNIVNKYKYDETIQNKTGRGHTKILSQKDNPRNIFGKYNYIITSKLSIK